MKYLVITLLFFTTATSMYAQKKVVPTIFTTVPVGQTKTLTINISDYDFANIKLFKGDLQFYQDKIIEISLDNSRTKLYITYNEFMLKEDLIKVFNQHHINYQLKEQDNQLSTNNPH